MLCCIWQVGSCKASIKAVKGLQEYDKVKLGVKLCLLHAFCVHV